MARSGSYLIRVGTEWALVSRLCPDFEIPFPTRKSALTYAKSIGWAVVRRQTWDRITTLDLETLEPLTLEERQIVRSGLDRIKMLRQVRKFVSPLGLAPVLNYFIKRTLKDIQPWL